MDVLALGNRVLSSRAGDLLLAVGNRLLYVDGIRKPLVRVLDRWLRAHLGDRGQAPRGWNKIVQQRRLIYLSVLHTVDRVIEKRILSPQVARVIARLWGRALCTPAGGKPAVQRFRRQYGFDPPWFLTLSPGHACNLRCAGCYANSGPEPGQAKLPWSTLDRIMTEAKELWGVPLFVISGGEPLAYRSQGKDVLDAVRKHADCLFLMFTNGTLIDRETAVRLSRLGNLTPALSVEGFRERTDQRRGAGTFDRVLNAMADLREAGVPFGISVTATRDNCAEILSDEFLDFFFAQQGAFYGFVFQYMPIGGSLALDWMPTSEQRVAFWRRSWQVIGTRHIFLLDFWNHGPLVEGCISAGRDRGYIYVDWQGKVMPCVFVPYAAANVQEIYARGGTLNDLWEAPFFQAIRQWQREYGYGRQELSRECNWMRPCPFRDHYDTLREWIDRYQPEPEDKAAQAALTDEAYRARMAAYSAEMARVSQEIWDVEYLG